MQSVTFVDGHCVRHARHASRNVQDSLGRHAHGGHVERLKPGLRHALSVSLGVRGQNGMLFRRNGEFVAERVMQDFLHVVQIRGDTVHDQRSWQTPSICTPPWAGDSAAIKVGVWHPRGRPLALAPRSPRDEGSNTHLSKNASLRNQLLHFLDGS